MEQAEAPARRLPRAALAPVPLVLLVLLVLCPFGGTASADTRPPQPPSDGPYLGALLDASKDSPDAYRYLLHVAPAAYGYPVRVPLDGNDVDRLAATLRAVHAEGAGLVLTLRPTTSLSSLDDAAVGDLVRQLSRAGVGKKVPVWVRPLPEMNAPWETWGQQPTAYVRTFTRIAAAVHADLANTAVVWQPANAAGYPFDQSTRTAEADAGRANDTALDTNGDGRLTSDDDPYGPYWPGADAVDWVGLAVMHYGSSFPFVRNERPPTGRLVAQLTGRFGYPDQSHRGQRNFYDRFVARTRKPMVLQTAALYLPGQPGDSELAIKRAWFHQVREVIHNDRYSGIGMVLWQELRRREDASNGKVADWRATSGPAVAASFRSGLVRAAGLTTGPAGPSTAVSPAPSSARSTGADQDSRGTVLHGVAAALVALGSALAAVALVAVAGSRTRRSWAYSERDGTRDLRIDLLRGIAICFVVVDHINIPSLWQLLTQEFIGPVSGAELFVSLSGVVLGVVYGRRVTDPEQWYDAATRMWRRALTLWVTALVVIFLVYLLALLPGVDARVATTFVDQGAGDTAGGSGRVYSLYGGFSSLADFPVPGWALRDVLLLRMGPSQINIMGLYVVLLLLAPIMTWLLLHRRWAALVAASVTLYAVGQIHPIRVLPSQFEDPFPLLDWQILFVLGLVAGWHRRRLLAASRQPFGRAVVGLLVVLTVAFAVFSWNNPHLSNAYDVRLALLPDATFTRLYDGWFARTTLEPGRLLAVICLLVTAFAALTAFWGPVHKALGWFLIPLGQATLYIFVLHVLFVVAVANVPAMRSSLLLGTVTHAIVLGVFWVMVRKRFLFGVVPR